MMGLNIFSGLNEVQGKMILDVLLLTRFVIPSNPITLSRYDTFKKELMKQKLVLGTRWQRQVSLCCS